MTLDPQALTAAALLEKARAYRPYNVLNDGALVQSLVAMIDDLQIKLTLAGPLYSARQLQPKLDEAYAALEPLARIASAEEKGQAADVVCLSKSHLETLPGIIPGSLTQASRHG